ncbi:MAG: HypC/HybG/HupF family hydrogenase formation chaperone [Anaerolineaceae bacterium]|jgi:hydrogenase expression/formation protein HypC|nr:HypC/HybG/HupF family hydrogenase formation chaperone [Anaerolineaceae bacterium]
MCLAIPGKIKKIYQKDSTRMGVVDFSGVELDVCLEAVPEAEVGNYVIVHAGFAISTLTEDEAQETLDLFDQIDALQAEEDKKSNL